MSFTFLMGINNSEDNKLSKNITWKETLIGELRDGCSIIDPIITVQIATAENIVPCNYAQIDSFGRKYFITDIKSVRTNLWEIHMHCDVLATYADQIRNHNAVIRRQENKWNLYLDDGIFKTYQNPSVITKAFPAGFTTQNFVLAVAGGD